VVSRLHRPGPLLDLAGDDLRLSVVVRFFERRNLLPFAVYCLLAGGLCIIRFA
jgi:hypothetical protein